MIPLSTRMRPLTLDEFVGQEHFLYPGSLLYNAIRSKTFDSAIFFGPSGTGKTTLARIIAREMDSDFVEINASSTGTKELKELIANARDKLFGLTKAQTYVYVDEFHRWNKLQQDSLLSALEEGVLRFIGSTTENPYFAVNNAVLSRVRNIYEFRRLTPEHVLSLLRRTLADKDRGLGGLDIKADEDALLALAELCSGDARIALDTLGFIAGNLGGEGRIRMPMVQEAMQRQTFFYDKREDRYNLLSALQKSIRGSDPDAAVHYLARLIEGGAGEMEIGRRLLVMAAEDIGMAYPNAVSVVTSCVQAAQMVGFPEARILLAEAVVLLAASPKSNRAYLALDKAMEDLRRRQIDDVPPHLKDSSYSGAKDRGLGIGYKYPHAFGGYVKQQYLPDNLHREGVRYYEPTGNGQEGAFKKFLEELENLEKKK